MEDAKFQNDNLSATDKENAAQFELLLDLLRDRVRSVVRGYHTGAYLVGRSGTSKTYTVCQTLNQLEATWAYRNSRLTPMGLWSFLADHPQHTVVLDDVHSFFGKEDPLQILLAALGGKPGEPRPVTYTAMDKRHSFDFSGGVIAISNKPLQRDPIADAVASRVITLNHDPSDEMLAAFMRKLASDGQAGLSASECHEVVDFVITESQAAEYRLDLRTAEKAWRDYRQWKDGNANRQWQELVRSSLRQFVRPVAGNPGTKADEIAWQQEIALHLFKTFPDNKQHRDETWREKTRSSTDTLYRRRRELKAEGRL